MKELTKEEKKQLLLAKFKPKRIELDDIKKYGVFWRPAMQNNFQWNLVTKCNTEEEALAEIKWRADFHLNGDMGAVIKNDKRFRTYEDETMNIDENGKVYEPDASDMSSPSSLANLTNKKSFYEGMPAKQEDNGFRSLAYYSGLELEYKGEFTIMPIWEIE